MLDSGVEVAVILCFVFDFGFGICGVCAGFVYFVS